MVVALAAIPVAMFSNFVRVIVLVLVTYYFGEAAAQGFVHDFAGLADVRGRAADDLRHRSAGNAPLSRERQAAKHEAHCRQLRRRPRSTAARSCSGCCSARRRRSPPGDSRRSASTISARQKLDDLVPKTIGPWKFVAASGLVVPPEDQLSRTLYSQLLTRVYSDGENPPMMLLIAQSASQTGILQVHRPESCYPASGYQISPVTQHACPRSARATLTDQHR